MDSRKWWEAMTTLTRSREQDYAPVVDALVPVLANLPPKIIAIGGHPLAGKTSLGRYLAWRFNISLIETDFLRIPGTSGRYREDEFARMIAHRLDGERPIIVEGVVILRLLAAVNRQPDYLIQVTNKLEIDDEDDLAEEVRAYDAECDPLSRADHVLQLGHDG